MSKKSGEFPRVMGKHVSIGAFDDKKFFTGKFPVPVSLFISIGRKKK